MQRLCSSYLQDALQVLSPSLADGPLPSNHPTVMRSTSLLSAVALALYASATPLAPRTKTQTLPVKRTRTIPPPDQPINIVAHDQARARYLVKKAKDLATPSKTARAASVSATNVLDIYTLSVGVGSPETYYNLIVDTGSSNTWVGANTGYTPTGTSTDTGNEVEVSYGSGEFEGEEYIDRVDLGSGLVINQQSIGVASSSQGFSPYDGIVGIGPTDLTEGTVDNTDEVPTVTDNLYAQGTIGEAVVGVYFAPTTSDDDVNGELTFGGVDTSKTTSGITYTPLTGTYPASYYWGIDQTVSYGSEEILDSAGIVDTGTTLVLIASDAFTDYMNAISGSYVDDNTGLLEIPADSVSSMQPLYFSIGGTDFEFSPTAQLLPQALNTYFGGEEGAYYSIVANLGTPSGEGLDFINGYFFIERFYSVFDTTNSQVGFATTVNT